jgi:hypothetical protein
MAIVSIKVYRRSYINGRTRRQRRADTIHHVFIIESNGRRKEGRKQSGNASTEHGTHTHTRHIETRPISSIKQGKKPNLTDRIRYIPLRFNSWLSMSIGDEMVVLGGRAERYNWERCPPAVSEQGTTKKYIPLFDSVSFYCSLHRPFEEISRIHVFQLQFRLFLIVSVHPRRSLFCHSEQYHPFVFLHHPRYSNALLSFNYFLSIYRERIRD